jgi:twitching motility protein PilT
MDSNSTPRVIRQILALVLAGRCFTDVQVRSGAALAIREPRGYVACQEGRLDSAEVEAFAQWIDPDWRGRLAQGGGHFDAALTLGEHSRLRCNVFRCGPGDRLAMTVRWLPFHVPAPDILGLPRALVAQIDPLRRGLILVTGPTGAGKTTTLACLLEQINHHRPAHILTVEQPVEYLLESRKSVVTQREIPTHLQHFAAGLEAARRQRPDVLMIGECRDRATVDTMLQAADAGHLVLGTLHARSAEEACQALLGFYGGDELQQRRSLLAAVLLCINSQVLTPSADGRRLHLSCELLINNAATAAVIRQGKLSQLENTVATGGTQAGASVLLNAALADRVRREEITYEDALRDSYRPEALQRLLSVRA